MQGAGRKNGPGFSVINVPGVHSLVQSSGCYLLQKLKICKESVFSSI